MNYFDPCPLQAVLTALRLANALQWSTLLCVSWPLCNFIAIFRLRLAYYAALYLKPTYRTSAYNGKDW